jgi:hypothetical protein
MKTQWVVVAVVLEVLSCASYVVAFLQVFDRAPLRLGARVALSEEAFGAAVSLGGAGSVAVGAWLMVERGAPARRIAERSAVLFLYTSAINVITLILAGLGLFLVLPGPGNPLLSIVPAAVGAIVLFLFLLLPRYVDRIARRVRPGRLRTVLTETAASVRDTKRLLFRPDWRIVGAIGYLCSTSRCCSHASPPRGTCLRWPLWCWRTKSGTCRTSSRCRAGSACSTAA